jgi:hypothetical protein
MLLKGLGGLLNCGVRYVVNLMEVYETDHSGNGFVSSMIKQMNLPFKPWLRNLGFGKTLD